MYSTTTRILLSIVLMLNVTPGSTFHCDIATLEYRLRIPALKNQACFFTRHYKNHANFCDVMRCYTNAICENMHVKQSCDIMSTSNFANYEGDYEWKQNWGDNVGAVFVGNDYEGSLQVCKGKDYEDCTALTKGAFHTRRSLGHVKLMSSFKTTP